jgi:hypothetical protein
MIYSTDTLAPQAAGLPLNLALVIYTQNISFCVLTVCGKRNPKGQPFISHGVEAKVGEFPWHVGIYKYSNGSLQQICGGSLINPSTVVSGMLIVILIQVTLVSC